MSERLRESVSALMDGEAGELELRRLLTESDEVSVRASWQSYHRQQVALKDESAEFLHWDISERVSSAIDDDGRSGVVSTGKRRWLQPVAGFAVAASVAAAVVMTSAGLAPANSGLQTGQPEMLSRVFPATGGVNPGPGSQSVNAATTAAPGIFPGRDALADEEARKRLDQYILRHTENAALNNGQGMISFARVASFEFE